MKTLSRRATSKIYNVYIRLGVRLLYRRPFRIIPGAPIISFSFDDFPRSALLVGGRILNEYRLAGTYYAALGLMGANRPVGAMFNRDDVDKVFSGGHELGCHTFDHPNPASTSPDEFEASILRNREALQAIVPEEEFETFSYPTCFPKPGNKQRTGQYFACCRSGGQTFNSGVVDLNHLAAYFLEQSKMNLAVAAGLIDDNARARGWLILATHDVCDRPSPYGCTPEFFECVVRYAVESGARILPVAGALRSLQDRVQANSSSRSNNIEAGSDE